MTLKMRFNAFKTSFHQRMIECGEDVSFLTAIPEDWADHFDWAEPTNLGLRRAPTRN